MRVWERVTLRALEGRVHQQVASRHDASADYDCFEIQKIDQIGARDAEIVPRFFEDVRGGGS